MIIKHVSIRKYVIKWHISLKLGDVIFEQTLQIIYVNDKQFEEHLSSGVAMVEMTFFVFQRMSRPDIKPVSMGRWVPNINDL